MDAAHTCSSRTRGDELILYDSRRHEAHCLGRIAALLWQYADGERPMSELSRLVFADLGTAPDEALVWHALDQLAERQLLEPPAAERLRATDWSRRDIMQRLGALAGLALVTSMPVPTAAQSGSPGIKGEKGDTGEKGVKGEKGEPGV